MSRTIKDSKLTKERRSKKKDQAFKHSYRKAKTNGFACDNFEEDYCPECGELTNFRDGFLECACCDWQDIDIEELYETAPAMDEAA